MTDQKTSKTNPPLYGTISNNVSSSREPGRLLLTGIWMVALSLVLLAVYLGWRVQTTKAASDDVVTVFPTQIVISPIESDTSTGELPDYSADTLQGGITRRTSLHTNIPSRSRTKVIDYTVATGDSVFGIAKSFNLEPETVLCAN